MEPKGIVKQLYKPLLSDIGQFMVAMLRKNSVILKDSWIGLSKQKSFSYLDLHID